MMRSLTTFAFLLPVFTLLAQPAPAWAKINIGESIEWVVTDSDRIVAGKIVKIEKAAPDQRWQVATVAIDKTLKGTPAEQATFFISPQWDDSVKVWLDEKKPMLFFLVQSRADPNANPQSKVEWTLREGRLAYCGLFLAKVNRDWVETSTMTVFTREFDVLTKAEDIFKRVDTIVTASGKSRRRESYQVDVPYKTPAHEELYSGSKVYLILPVGEQYGTKRTEVQLDKHRGFILHPAKPADRARPWVWYAPTIGAHPNKSNEWVLKQLLDRGFFVCGVNVGESYGSPAGRKVFTEFHNHVVREFDLEHKARLLAQSRGGLMLYNWAAENQKGQCIAGIYPVCDLRSYPD